MSPRVRSGSSWQTGAVSWTVGDLATEHHHAAHTLNQAEVPRVGPVTPDAFARLVDWSEIALALTRGDELGAFALVLGPGCPYESGNYRWFGPRYESFGYLDRIVVAPEHRRWGLGRMLYSEVDRRLDAPWFCCEVNIAPRNEASLAFHEALGFEPVGERDHDEVTRVVMLARRVGSEPFAS